MPSGNKSPFQIGQKVKVLYTHEQQGTVLGDAHVTSVHPLADGRWEIVASTSEGRALNYRVTADDRSAYLQPAS